MPRSKDEDRELQIELTKLQIQHEEAHSHETVMLSIVASTLLATASLFVTLIITTGNQVYGLVAIIYDIPLLLFVAIIMHRMQKTHESLDEDITKLKDHYLSRQEPKEPKKEGSSSEQT